MKAFSRTALALAAAAVLAGSASVASAATPVLVPTTQFGANGAPVAVTPVRGWRAPSRKYYRARYRSYYRPYYRPYRGRYRYGFGVGYGYPIMPPAYFGYRF